MPDKSNKSPRTILDRLRESKPARAIALLGAGATLATLTACGPTNNEAPAPAPTTASSAPADPGEYTPSATPTPVETQAPVSSIDPPEVLDPANNPDGLRTETYSYTVGGESLTYEELVDRWSIPLTEYPTPADVNKQLAVVIGEYMNTGCAPADMEQAPDDKFSPTSSVAIGCPSAAYFFYGNAFKQAVTGTTEITFDDQATAALFDYHATMAGFDQVAKINGITSEVNVDVQLVDQTVVDNGKEPTDAGYAADTAFGISMTDNAGAVLPGVAESRESAGLPENFSNLFRFQGELTVVDGKWNLDTFTTLDAQMINK